MRLCERKSSAHEWISQKTYKPRNEELAASAESFTSADLFIPLRSQETQDTKAMVRTIIVFFVPANEAKVGLFADSVEKSNR